MFLVHFVLFFISFSHSLHFTSCVPIYRNGYICPQMFWFFVDLNLYIGSSHHCGLLIVPSHLLPILFLFITAWTFLLVFCSAQLMLVSWFSNQSWHAPPLSYILGVDLPEYGSSGNHHQKKSLLPSSILSGSPLTFQCGVLFSTRWDTGLSGLMVYHQTQVL